MKKAEIPTICRVSTIASGRALARTGLLKMSFMSYLPVSVAQVGSSGGRDGAGLRLAALRGDAALVQVVQDGVDVGVFRELNAQVAELLAAEGLDAAGEDVEVDVEVPGDAGEDGFLGAVTGEEDFQDRPALQRAVQGLRRRQRQERPGQLAVQLAGDVPQGAVFDDAAPGQQGHRVADALHDVHFVGDDQHGQLQALG